MSRNDHLQSEIPESHLQPVVFIVFVTLQQIFAAAVKCYGGSCCFWTVRKSQHDWPFCSSVQPSPVDSFKTPLHPEQQVDL